ncbi:MAG: hypothetical protein WBC21_04465 [Minisyncoccales bacterium]
MKVVVDSGHYGASVSVDAGKTIIKRDGSDFPVRLEDIKREGIEAIEAHTIYGLTIRIEQENGWVVYIDEDVYHKGVLIVTRLRRSETDKRQYLSRYGEWLEKSKELGPLPDNAVRIPILTKE